MSQTIINVKCTDQDLEITSKPLIASGGSNEDVVQWEFSEHWDGFEKTAVFYRAGDDHYHIPVDEDNKSVVPHEVTANLGQFIFGVFGVLGDIIRTSEVVSYDVQKGALYSQCNIQNTSPNIYTEILRRISALEEGQDPEQIQKIVDEALKEAEESGAFDGPPGADGKSAYEVAVANGFEGTEEEWLASLKGEDGEQGPIGETGADGYSPVKGTDYYTDEDKQEIITDMLKQVPQPDWNQNDPTQPDYVKNRTHYTEIVEVPETVLLPETSFTTNEDGQVLYPDSIPDVEVSKEYTVMWNGVEYVTTAQAMEEDGVTMPVLGNFGAMTGGTDTGEPFIIAVVPADMIGSTGVGAIIMPMDDSTELTVSIKGAGGTVETVHQLDPKFIPDMYYEETENKVIYSGSNTTGEAWTAVFKLISGQTYIVNWNGTDYVSEAADGTFGGVYECVYLGNPKDCGGTDNGEPFVVAYIPALFESQGWNAVITPYDGSTSISVKISGDITTIRKIPEKYLPDFDIPAFIEGSAEGSIRTEFADEEDDEYTMGEYAFAIGYNTRASGKYSFSSGYHSKATGNHSYAEGHISNAIGSGSHAEGSSDAYGDYSHAEGGDSIARGDYSHTEGWNTIAHGSCQHVQGRNNIEDKEGKYLHIVGNGTFGAIRSNAHTLDWDGNAWYAGSVEGTALILKSSTEGSTKRFKITVDDSGTLTATEIVETTE